MKLEIVYLDPHELTPYENNTRKHSPEDIEQIKASIQADGFNDPNPIVSDSDVSPTITANGQIFRAVDKTHYHSLDFISTTTFPQDYDTGAEEAQYICGMSVPPVMMAQVSAEVYNQWLKP